MERFRGMGLDNHFRATRAMAAFGRCSRCSRKRIAFSHRLSFSMMMIAREGLVVFTRNSIFLDKGVFKRIDLNERPVVLNMGLGCTCIFVLYPYRRITLLFTNTLSKSKHTSKFADRSKY